MLFCSQDCVQSKSVIVLKLYLITRQMFVRELHYDYRFIDRSVTCLCLFVFTQFPYHDDHISLLQIGV